VSFLDRVTSPLPPNTQIETDASGTWGCGVLFNNFWFQLEWSTDWKHMDIMAKELVPIALSCALWGALLPNKILEFKCDNRGLVDVINKGSSKERVVMHLLRCLWLFSAFHEITIRASHVPGVLNTAADMLSRNRAVRFLCDYPWAACNPTLIPTSLLMIMSPKHLDWISSAFLRHLHTINLTRNYSTYPHHH